MKSERFGETARTRANRKHNAPMPLASITTTITDWIGQNGVYAVFVLMAVDALLPVGGELIMLYAGCLPRGRSPGTRLRSSE